MSTDYIFTIDVPGTDHTLTSEHDADGFVTTENTGLAQIKDMLEDGGVDLGDTPPDDVAITITRDQETLFSGTLQEYMDNLPERVEFEVSEGKIEFKHEPGSVIEVEYCDGTERTQPHCDNIIAPAAGM